MCLFHQQPGAKGDPSVMYGAHEERLVCRWGKCLWGCAPQPGSPGGMLVLGFTSGGKVCMMA
jgi:hypothetical protein